MDQGPFSGRNFNITVGHSNLDGVKRKHFPIDPIEGENTKLPSLRASTQVKFTVKPGAKGHGQ